MTVTDVMPRPEVEIIPPSGPVETSEEKVWQEINPCPVCSAHQIEAPERDARTARHCFRCGFRPGQSVNATLLMPQQLDTQHLLAQLREGVVADILAAFAQAGMAVPTPSTRPVRVEVTPGEGEG